MLKQIPNGMSTRETTIKPLQKQVAQIMAVPPKEIQKSRTASRRLDRKMFPLDQTLEPFSVFWGY